MSNRLFAQFSNGTSFNARICKELNIKRHNLALEYLILVKNELFIKIHEILS